MTSIDTNLALMWWKSMRNWYQDAFGTICYHEDGIDETNYTKFVSVNLKPHLSPCVSSVTIAIYSTSSFSSMVFVFIHIVHIYVKFVLSAKLTTSAIAVLFYFIKCGTEDTLVLANFISFHHSKPTYNERIRNFSDLQYNIYKHRSTK